MTETLPTRAEAEAAARADRVSRDLQRAGIDPATGLPPATPPQPASRPEHDVLAQLAPGAARIRDDARETTRLMRERHEEEQAELAAFCETIAEFFGCRDLATDSWHVRFKSIWQDARRYVYNRKAEAERRAADPTSPGRDASGRFVRG